MGTAYPELNDDLFLTITGALGSVLNFLARLFWGNMLDRFAYKKLWIVNGCLTIFVTLTF